MCKILGISGLKMPLAQKLGWAFVKAASEPMVDHDKDGFGYALLMKDGRVYGEKWQDTAARFSVPSATKDRLVYEKQLGEFCQLPPVSLRFGSPAGGSGMVSIIAHSRMATCGRSIENTHPFFYEGTALVHNGVITNTVEHEKKVSSCDSESILTLYREKGVRTDTSKWQEVADELEGFYAAMLLSKDALDIVKSNGTSLFVAWVNRLDAFVFATTAEIIQMGAEAIKSKLGPIVPLKDRAFLRLNPYTGVVETRQWFTQPAPAFNRRDQIVWAGQGINGRTMPLSPRDWGDLTDDDLKAIDAQEEELS